MSNAAIFLDRDDTLNDDPGYINHPSQLKLLPFVKEKIVSLKQDYKFILIVISNQSGITRGLISKEEVEKVNTELNKMLNNSIDAFYYCPYHPDFDSTELSDCRKPSPKMIVQASKDWDIELSKSYMIGDRASDIECAINAKVKSVLIVQKGNLEEINLLHNSNKTPNFVAQNFTEAYNYIVEDCGR